ncbi:hypothetical protein [Amycolatopsis sp.]|uniref:hypothetical protein n=1 Tax=Amycolatopsis sp. TaxID=37632 RepID=UPI002C9615A2|nr:hypothetical protein [Amycolatopsis sp.]HVV12077.1 hypothetical protein [Amycolatopsis sp.]
MTEAINVLSVSDPPPSAAVQLASQPTTSTPGRADVEPLIQELYSELFVQEMMPTQQRAHAARWVAQNLIDGNIDAVAACNRLASIANADPRMLPHLATFVSLMSDFAESGPSDVDLQRVAITESRRLIETFSNGENLWCETSLDDTI